ncbi:MAG: hypothetical protein CBD47_03865 [Synechococcus sp. TMED187]|nr:MAG: hypothetical protein CBD47_03865 [Synechococcus sp. TMED187]
MKRAYSALLLFALFMYGRPQHPLVLDLGLVEGAEVAERDEVGLVDEGDDAARVGLRHREEVLQDRARRSSSTGCGARCAGRPPRPSAGQGSRGASRRCAARSTPSGRAVRHVRDDQARRVSPLTQLAGGARGEGTMRYAYRAASKVPRRLHASKAHFGERDRVLLPGIEPSRLSWAQAPRESPG